MSFETPAPDLKKLITAWESWERGEEQPGRTLASLKTAGMAAILQELVANGWAPASK
jgi:endonuclease YncB( thermonuclease family)